jgi:5'-phosphate synthase pdxT subunit
VRVGVIALQGATAAHAAALERLGAEPVQIRTPADLDGIDAVVLPGGESTTISFLLDSNRLRAPLADRLSAGLPTLGTCAGMILLASEVLDGRSDQRSFGAIDLAVRRNGFGRQLDSFEADLAVTGLDEPFHAVFIRAPVVERVGEGVEVLAEVDGRAVLCRRGPVLVSSFHPELTDDLRLHELFLESINSEVTPT